jgi:hypothetical protein
VHSFNKKETESVCDATKDDTNKPTCSLGLPEAGIGDGKASSSDVTD